MLRRPRHRRARAGLGRHLPARRSASTRGAVGARARRPRRAARGAGRPAHGGRGGAADARRASSASRPRSPASTARCGSRRDHLRREPLRGTRLAARLLPDLGDPGRHADRPARRRARLVLRPAGRRRAGAPASQPRSFFLKRLLTDVVFGEAGLGTLDPKAEARRTWIWRGAAVGAAAVLVLGALALTVSYLSNRGAVAAQASEFDRLRSYLTPVAARQAPLEPLDLDLALDAATEVQNARAPLPGSFARLVGPSAAPQVEAAQATAYDHTLETILEPRMVALLEATMWRQIRDPEFQLDALKTYRMMTGFSPMDTGFVSDWWTNALPELAAAPAVPERDRPDAPARRHRPHALDETFITPDDALVGAALQTVCSIPLAKRAYNALLSDPAATALPDWIPANAAGPNGRKVFTRHSGKDLRSASRASIPTPASTTWCSRGSTTSPPRRRPRPRSSPAAAPRAPGPRSQTLAQDMLKLYNDDFIAKWDGFLHDVTLAPLDRPRHRQRQRQGPRQPQLVAEAPADRRRRRNRPRPPARPRRPGRPAGGISKYLGKLGKLGKLATTGAKFVPTAGGPAPRHQRPGRLRPLQADQGRHRRGRRRAARPRRRDGRPRPSSRPSCRPSPPARPEPGDQGPGRPRPP